MSERGDIRIGVSGWTYPPWRGHFYPEGLPQKRELAYAAASFNALEINGTFYGLQTPASFMRWRDAVPDGFVFAIKGSRYITHMRRLNAFETPLANFFASGVLALGSRLGPILWQFPPSFAFDAERLEPFLEALPKTTREAARLGRKHDGRLRARAYLRAGDDRPVRHAVEIRHDSFRDEHFVELLRRYGVALVCADTVEWPRLMDLTADFAYCRLHGATELYRSGYSGRALDGWAKRAEAWATGRTMRDGDFVTRARADRRRRDVFVFFDNTDKRRAPADAKGLMRRLSVAPPGKSASIARN